jgi:hypothetical protein
VSGGGACMVARVGRESSAEGANELGGSGRAGHGV